MSHSSAPSAHRQRLAEYLAAGRHVLPDGRVKPMWRVGEELGTSRETVQRWLRRDHREAWLKLWAMPETHLCELISNQPFTAGAPCSVLGGLPDPDDPSTFDPLEDER